MLTLELPLGLGFTEANVVSEVLPSGSASDGRIRKGDRVTHVDGVDVRGGRRAMVDALEESRARHNQPVVTLRVEHAQGEPHRPPLRPGWLELVVALTLPMGIGFDCLNVVAELEPGGSAYKDGVRVGDRATHVNGVLVLDGCRPIVAQLRAAASRQTLVFQRAPPLEPRIGDALPACLPATPPRAAAPDTSKVEIGSVAAATWVALLSQPELVVAAARRARCAVGMMEVRLLCELEAMQATREAAEVREVVPALRARLEAQARARLALALRPNH